MFFTDGYSSSLSASTIAGNRTSFTTISVYSATAQWYNARCHCRVSKSFLWAVTHPWHTPARCWCHRPPHAARSGVCAPSRLDCHTSTNAGSFQRDSARWESWHRHRFRLHDRRASCPFSGAVRRSRLPGIVSFHRHSPPEGCGPSCPEMWSGVRPAAYCTQRGWRQMHRRHPIRVKEEGE